MTSSRNVLLVCHPATSCPAVAAVDVRLFAAGDGGLGIGYSLLAPPGGLAIPAPRQPGPADGLWQHTCCEAFMAEAGGTGYREFNFSPSGQWAVYGFSRYRQRDESFRPGAAPSISVSSLADRLELEAVLPAALLPSGARLHLGLSAVIETVAGEISYWALAHAGPRPDFHLRSTFSLELDVTDLIS